MTEIIVVLIVFSLMGSALWILPSKKERQIMDLRMGARKHGIQVQLTQVALPDKWDKVTTKQAACAYHLHRDKPLKDFTQINLYPFEVWKHELLVSGWYVSAPMAIEQELREALEQIPVPLFAIEIKAEGVSLYWKEQGSQETVDHLANVLRLLLAWR